jgi:hypothetical protein
MHKSIKWWAVGSVLLLAALWGGPHAWAAGLENCGQGTVPGPCAVDDGVGTEYGVPVTLAVLANDRDRSGTGLHVTAVTTATHGLVTHHAGDSVTYTPQTGFSGADTFGYTVADGLGIEARGAVVVFVAAQQEQKPIVKPLDPQVENDEQFEQNVSLPDGTRVAITTTVVVPPGALPFTVAPTDTLSILYTPVLTPKGNVAEPPDVGVQVVRPRNAGGDGATRTAGGGVTDVTYAWTHLTFYLDMLYNGQSLLDTQLLHPITFTVTYDAALLGGLDEGTLAPYYWTQGHWSKAGVRVVARDRAHDRLVYTVDRIVGEISFFARGPFVFMPAVQR